MPAILAVVVRLTAKSTSGTTCDSPTVIARASPAFSVPGKNVGAYPGTSAIRMVVMT